MTTAKKDHKIVTHALVIDPFFTLRYADGTIILAALRPDGRWRYFDPREGRWAEESLETGYATARECQDDILDLARECGDED